MLSAALPTVDSMLWFLSLSVVLTVTPPAAFARSPTDLLAWATSEPQTAPAAAEILLDSTELSIHPAGREHWHTVLTYRVLDSDSLLRHLKEIHEDFNWTSTRPEIRARVMSPDGTEHWLDPSLLTESPATERPGMYADRRAIARGAVVEVETRSAVTPWTRCSSCRLSDYRLGARTTTPSAIPLSQSAMNGPPGPVASDTPPPL